MHRRNLFLRVLSFTHPLRPLLSTRPPKYRDISNQRCYCREGPPLSKLSLLLNSTLDAGNRRSLILFGNRWFGLAAEEAMTWLESLDDGNLDLNNLQFTRQKLEKAVLAGDEGDNWQVQRLSLACLASAGIGGDQDIHLAERCLLSVAEAGNTVAMFRLGELYLDDSSATEAAAREEPSSWSTSTELDADAGPRAVDPTLAKAVR
jgi:TPR repeat protein